MPNFAILSISGEKDFAILSIFGEKNFANPKTHQRLREGRRHHLPAGLHDRIAVN